MSLSTFSIPDNIQYATSQQLINNIKITNAKIYRAKFLDSLFGTNEPPIPFDIDDLDLTDAEMALQIDPDQTSTPLTADERVPKINQKIRDKMINQMPPCNPLHWEASAEEKYLDNLGEFSNALHKIYQKNNMDLFQQCQRITGPTFAKDADSLLADVFNIMDVTPVIQITSYTKNLNFGNEMTFVIAVASMLSEDQVLAFLPRENDVISVIIQYPDGNLERFIGFIGSVSRSEVYGQLTSMTISAFGMSKMLVINRMVIDRAVLTQYQGGELSELGLAPWSTNALASSTADEIFTTILVNQLGLKPANKNSKDEVGKKAFQMSNDELEWNYITRTLLVQINTQRIGLAKELGDQIKLSDADVQRIKNQWHFNKELSVLNQPLDQLKQRADNIIQNYTSQTITFTTGYKYPDNPSYVKHEQLGVVYEICLARKNVVENELKTLQADKSMPPFLRKIDFTFDFNAFTTLFQSIYIPLITYAALRFIEGTPVALFRGRRALAFDVLFRDGFRMFFSELAAPASILDALRTTAKFALYENENNQIVCEIPRYNDFGADDKAHSSDGIAEDIREFIITNPLSFESARQDMDMITRMDTKNYILYIGALPFTMTSREYTDIAILSRYGMRTQGPIYNPNAQSPASTALWSALEVTTQNSLTRTAELTVAADRKYKLGRLYFIARTTGESVFGGARTTMSKPSEAAVNLSQPVSLTESTTFGAPVVTPPSEVGVPITSTLAQQGHLPIIPASPEETMLPRNTNLDGAPTKPTLVPVEGYVGYLHTITTAITPGQISTHRLSMNFVRRARLLVQDKNTIIGANFKILPDLNAVIDVLEDRRKTNADLSARQPDTQYPPIVDGAEKISGDGEIEEVYITPVITNAHKKGPDYYTAKVSGYGMQPIQLAVPFFGSSQGSKFCVDRNKPNRSPVIQVKAIDGPITKSMVEILHLIDLRLRGLSVIYPIGGSIWHRDTRRVEVLKPIFIPHEGLNSFYYLSSLQGYTISVLDAQPNIIKPAAKNFIVQGSTLTSMSFAMSSDKAIPDHPPTRIRIAAQSVPAKLSKNNFVLLRFFAPSPIISPPGAASIIVAKMQGLGNASWGRAFINTFISGSNLEDTMQINITLNANTFNKKQFVLFGGKALKAAKDNLKIQLQSIATSLEDLSRLQSQLENAINALPTQGTTEEFLPVVLHAMPNYKAGETFILDNANTGTPFSLIDLGWQADLIKFPANSSLGTTDPNKADNAAHNMGNAVDLSLVPWYIKTGIAMKNYGPHILSPQFNPRNSARIFQAVVPDIKWKNSDENIWEHPRIKIVGHNTSGTPDAKKNSEEAIQTLIDRWGVNDVLSLSDLEEGDKTWYHIAVDIPPLTPANLVWQ